MVSIRKGFRFGFCYFPQILRVEDFSPYRVLDYWTPEKMFEDFRIMKAIGCTSIRIHITPPVPGAICYDRFNVADRQIVPITGEKYLRMYDLAMKMLHDLGFKIHFDIGSSISELTAESIQGWVKRYKNFAESFQLGNENYGLFKKDKRLIQHLKKLMVLCKKLAPDSRLAVDMLADEMNEISRREPTIFSMMDPLVWHYYPLCGYVGWSEEIIDKMISFFSGKEDTSSIVKFGKEIWITEIIPTSLKHYGGETPEKKQAETWRKIVTAIAEKCPLVTRIYHTWYTQKFHSFESSMSANYGVVNYDNSPNPLTMAFKEMAERYAPKDALFGQLKVSLPVVVLREGNTFEMVFRLTNTGDRPLNGVANLEIPPEIETLIEPLQFEIPPKTTTSFSFTCYVTKAKRTASHIFLRIVVRDQIHYGWGVLIRPQPIILSSNKSPLNGVHYVPNLLRISEFLKEYANECVIIVGTKTGMHAEWGHRLRIVLQSIRGSSIPIKPWFMVQEVWSHPLIIIGGPEENPLAYIIEKGFPTEERTPQLHPEEGIIRLIEHPFKNQALVDFAGQSCPATLYFTGGSEIGMRKCVFDLISCIWGPKKDLIDEHLPRAWVNPNPNSW